MAYFDPNKGIILEEGELKNYESPRIVTNFYEVILGSEKRIEDTLPKPRQINLLK